MIVNKFEQCHQQRLKIAKSIEATYSPMDTSTFDHGRFVGNGFQHFIERDVSKKIVLTEFNTGSGLSFHCSLIVRYMDSPLKKKERF